MNLTLECEAEHHRNCEVTLVTDAFREGEENVCSYETFNYNELVGVAFERRKESASCERGEENIHDILAKHASVKNIKYEISDGELTASFDLALSLVARSADNGECFTVKLESPFSEKIKSVGVSESSKIRINITPCEISPAFDSERIYADCDVIITVLAEDAKSVKILRELSSKKKERTDCRRITVYYPENGDTLWSVSKKYGVSPEKIAYANMMEADNGADLASRGKIIIP